MKIFIAAHKSFSCPDNIDNIYIPTQVGLGDDLGYFRENNLDNIAYKNPSFCELTLLYYIWKNIQTDIVGLVHYRRFFFKKNYMRKIGTIYFPFFRYYTILTEHDINSILDKYDIIVPKVNNIKEESVKHQYGMYHHIEDWNIVKDIVKEKHPDYLNSFEIIENGKIFWGYNMFIAPKNVMMPYFEWLFDILFEAERRIDLSNYSDYQKRVFGFLSERLFSVWLIHNKSKLKIYETKVKMITN